MEKKKKKGKQNPSGHKQEAAVRKNHIHFEDVEVPQVVEPRPVCSICGEPIEAIIEAISEPDGGYSHFDCVLKKIAEQEHVQGDDKVSYIGHGCFAVMTHDEEGKWVIKTSIQYESTECFNGMKSFIEGQKQ